MPLKIKITRLWLDQNHFLLALWVTPNFDSEAISAHNSALWKELHCGGGDIRPEGSKGSCFLVILF